MKRTLVALVILFLFPLTGQTGVASEEQAGWHLTGTEYLVPSVDLDVNGGPIERTMAGNGAALFDYHQDEVGDHSVVIENGRTDAGGKVLANARWQVLWDEPAAFLPAGAGASVTVEQVVIEENTWKAPALRAAIDVPDLEIGYSSSSPNTFHQPNGGFNGYRDTSEEVSAARETMTSESPLPEGEAGDRIALYISFGDGYSMRYTYTWGVAPVPSANAGVESGIDGAGWRLTGSEYLVPSVDVDVNGGPVERTMAGNGAALFDYHQDEVGDHSVVIENGRTDAGGKVLANARWQVLWDEPAAFLPAGAGASVTVEQVVIEENTWKAPALRAAIDVPDLEIGYSSSSPNTFHQPNGGFNGYRDTSEEVSAARETMTSESPLPEGEAGDRIALYISFGDGYGMRYTYTWVD